ncbi:hypothetical protein [Buttiauxella massiliensis]|uniref:hypothetical protein n=1 Tax=Buttiauxella massiliensis TaxID=2831590 RepID=UPI00125F391C|nr:hypothetical protein [Buttiauxella massiliensis]
MAKHPTGKRLKAEIKFNNKSALVYVVKGSRIQDAPDESNPEYPGDIHMSMPARTQDFDFELNEILNTMNDRAVVVFMCPHDVVFSYAYDRIKAISKGDK